MKFISLSVLAIFATGIALSAADTISGKWQFHQSIAGNENDMSCTFTQTGDDLAGTCDGPGAAIKITGKVSEKKVTWSYQFDYNGSPLTMTYSGTLTSDSKMTGTVNVDPFGVGGEFSGAPVK